MATLNDSQHFVANNDLLRIDGSTSFQDVYKKLNDAGRGGFLLVEDGQIRTYVKAADLADAVVRRAVKDVQKFNSVPPGDLNLRLAEASDPIAQMLANFMQIISQTPISQIVQQLRSAILVEVDQIKIQLDADEIPLQNQDHRVFEVYDAGKTIGWYLNHEEVRDTTTEKPRFICVNGHDNPDTDSGTCYSCSGSFTDTNRISSMFAV